MPKTRTVAIIGGGAIGSAIACYLTADPAFAGRVVVIERDPTYKKASSALSASSIRQQFSTPLNIELSRYGFDVIANAETSLAVGDDRPALGLHESGYLVLASDAGAENLRAVNAIQKTMDVPVDLLDAQALTTRFPWISAEGISLGSLGLRGEGWFDGYGLLMAFRKKARAQGATFIAEEASGLTRTGRRITAVRLAGGGQVDCDVVINAAGPWAARVAHFAGIDLPVRARRRMVFVFSCREKLEHFPLIVDPAGLWVRPEGSHYITGTSPKDGEPDPDDLPLDVDHSLFENEHWPILATRVPAFETIKLVNAWAGYYEYNTLDQNGVVGPHPDLENMVFANGFSGHGLQHAPGIGRGIAELVVHGQYLSLDLSPLSFDRVIANRPLTEINVI